MKTILYNTNTQKLTYHAKEGYYLVDGVRPTLPSGIVELTEVEEIQPSYNSETQRLTDSWVIDLTALEYRKEFTVVNLTARELAAKEWVNVEYTKKLTFNRSLLSVDLVKELVIELVVIGGQPHEFDNVNFSIWGDEAPAKYAAAIQSAVTNGTATITNRPTILD